MRLLAISDNGADSGAVLRHDGLLAPLRRLGNTVPETVEALISSQPSDAERATLASDAERLPVVDCLDRGEVAFGPVLQHPGKILGIGLNYKEHAEDLGENAPVEEPASFFKQEHTIIGPDEPIVLPPQSKHVTAEAEMGLVFGSTCVDVEPEDALRHIAGICLVLDQTAVDILQRNPRFLTRAKNFPTFLSLGPILVTLDEVLQSEALRHLLVTTATNGSTYRASTVAHMTHGPQDLVSFHSKVMPFFPGDLLLTGTPGGAEIDHGDIAQCRIEGIGELQNPVIRNQSIS